VASQQPVVLTIPAVVWTDSGVFSVNFGTKKFSSRTEDRARIAGASDREYTARSLTRNKKPQGCGD
jgi:hypothetical protein